MYKNQKLGWLYYTPFAVESSGQDPPATIYISELIRLNTHCLFVFDFIFFFLLWQFIARVHQPTEGDEEKVQHYCPYSKDYNLYAESWVIIDPAVPFLGTIMLPEQTCRVEYCTKHERPREKADQMHKWAL